MFSDVNRKRSVGKLCGVWLSYSIVTFGEAFVRYHTDGSNSHSNAQGFQATYRTVGQLWFDHMSCYMYKVNSFGATVITP